MSNGCIFVAFCNSPGSVVCEMQVVMAPVSSSKVREVLVRANSTGTIGNLSVIPNSFESNVVPGKMNFFRVLHMLNCL